MTINEIVAISMAVGGALGAITAIAVKWGVNRSSVSNLGKSHNSLKQDFIKHKDNTRIHIDPDRDIRAAMEFRETIDKHFKEVKRSLFEINNRCAGRGAECANHFSRVEKQIAVITGKANGNDK